MGIGLYTPDEQPERRSIQQSLLPIKPMPQNSNCIIGQISTPHKKGNYTNRDIDGEQPGPRSDRQYTGGQSRSRYRCYGHYGRIEPNPFTQPPLGIDQLN